MVKKQLVGLVLLSLLSMSKNGFAMKRKNEWPKPLGRELIINNMQEPLKKKPKSFQNEDEEYIIEIPLENFQISSFDNLPIELKIIILKFGLETIIRSNSQFRPLQSVKEYLDVISLVNAEFMDIAKYLRGKENNITSDENTEPIYKIMIKDWFVPKHMRNQDQGVLNDQLKNAFNSIETDTDIKYFDVHLDLGKSSLSTESELEIMAELTAKLLIAGANPDSVFTRDDRISIYIVGSKFLHHLIPLLILKHASFKRSNKGKGNTALMHAIFFPDVLRLLLNYDSSEIDFLDYQGRSALSMAASYDKPESIKLLLEHGASVDPIRSYEHSALNFAISHNNVECVKLLLKNGASTDKTLSLMAQRFQWMSLESAPPSLLELCVRIVKLLIKYGAVVDNLPDGRWDPIIRLLITKIKHDLNMANVNMMRRNVSFSK